MDELDGMINPLHPDVFIEHSIARAEVAIQAANRTTADLWAAIEDTIGAALRSPQIFVVHDAPLSTSARSEFAERAAVADLAVRLNMSEPAVRVRFGDALTLRTRLPRLWVAFRQGRVHPANAHTAAALADTLPDDPATWAAFDEAVLDTATRLAPGRFRLRARVVRERIHNVSLVERARAARETRGVWLENDLDGMANLALRLPAEVAHQRYDAIDAAARSLADVPDEARTLAQLRADVAGDLLAGSDGVGPQVSVAVSVPVVTLLGQSDEPATLDGYGPIDADTARRLAAHAPSFTRLLTHPISGGLLDIDRSPYRPPADLKKWLAIVDQVCGFPGCNRPAWKSDIDHVHDYQYGGKTRADNLVHLCRHHHRLKHMTRWGAELTSDVDPVDGVARRVKWTSPTGYVRDADPPPF